MVPEENEPICLVSYEIAAILVNGGPDSRSGFWKAYRRELEHNRKTEYRNYHIELCRPHLSSLKMNVTQPVYFRQGRLMSEKMVSSELVRIERLVSRN